MKDEKEEIKPAPLGERKGYPVDLTVKFDVCPTCNRKEAAFCSNSFHLKGRDAVQAFFEELASKQVDLPDDIQKALNEEGVFFKLLGESSEEQKPHVNDDMPDFWEMVTNRWGDMSDNAGVVDGCIMVWEKFVRPLQAQLKNSSPSPTSEPPEEQEELWREVQNYLSKWVIDINDLKKNFTLHRKRD